MNLALVARDGHGASGSNDYPHRATLEVNYFGSVDKLGLILQQSDHCPPSSCL